MKPLGARIPTVQFRWWDSIRDRAGVWVYRLVVWIALAAIAAPLLIIVLGSFTDTAFLRFPPGGLSLEAYERFLGNNQLKGGLVLSLQVALVVMVLTLALAGPAAYALDRYRFKGRGAVEALLMTPLLLPQLVLALAILMVLNQLGLGRNLWSLVAAHVLIAVPFVVRVLLSAFATFDRGLEEASASLGAKPTHTLRRVTMPLLQPAILSSAVLAFVISFGNITVSAFLSGIGNLTLPVAIFTAAEFSQDPAFVAVSVIVILISLVIVTVVEKLTGLERIV